MVDALFGPLLGIAVAFGYIGCVANMQRWFPDYKGLAAGVTVMSVGVGAFMWQLVGGWFMKVRGGRNGFA